MVEFLRERLRPRWIRRVLNPFSERAAHRRLRLFAGYVLLDHYPFECTATDHQNILDEIDCWADGRPTERLPRAVQSFFDSKGEAFGKNFDIWGSPWTEAASAAAWNHDPTDPLSGLHGCGLIRELFGNPFRPITLPSSWRSDTVLSLARQMYESRDFVAMPILADALQDAGCDSDDILEHCRGPGPHVRGCWVADRVLNKE
jgi:hypothetical protein